MRIYIAGSFGERDKFREIAGQLRAAGQTVTSRWLDAPKDTPYCNAQDLTDPDTCKLAVKMAAMCLEDLGMADTVVIFTEVPSSTGGYHVELGRTLNTHDLIIVGPLGNVFHSYAVARLGAKHYATPDEFLAAHAPTPSTV